MEIRACARAPARTRPRAHRVCVFIRAHAHRVCAPTHARAPGVRARTHRRAHQVFAPALTRAPVPTRTPAPRSHARAPRARPTHTRPPPRARSKRSPARCARVRHTGSHLARDQSESAGAAGPLPHLPRLAPAPPDAGPPCRHCWSRPRRGGELSPTRRCGGSDAVARVGENAAELETNSVKFKARPRRGPTAAGGRARTPSPYGSIYALAAIR